MPTVSPSISTPDKVGMANVQEIISIKCIPAPLECLMIEVQQKFLEGWEKQHQMKK